MSVRRSLGWTYIAQAICFAISFGSTVVIARLVSPRDFGIFAMAGAATTIINVLMQFGLARYIMRANAVDRDFLRSVFTVNVMMTLLYVGSILVSALASTKLFGSAEVGRFLMIFALFPIFAMFEFVPAALAARDMRFGLAAAMAVLRAVVMATTTIVLALRGYGYMSFAWAQVLSWLATAICYNVALWRPDVWKPSFKGIRSILQFGWQMIGINGVSQLSTRGSEVALGSLLGLVSLGFYNRAASLPAQIYGNIYGAGGNVLFSRMSKEFRETGQVHETYFRFMRLILALLWPMMLGLAILSQPVINLLYGAKWQAAANPLSLLACAFTILIAIGMNNEIFILRRETNRQLKIEGCRAVVGTTLFVCGAFVSLTLAAAAKLAEASLALLLYHRHMNRLIGGPSGALRRVYIESAVVTLPSIAPAMLLMLWSGWSPATPLLYVAAAIVAGVIGWSLILIKLQHPIYEECVRLVHRSN
jgi:O-antigen/teichoic acid export membrane protein